MLPPSRPQPACQQRSAALRWLARRRGVAGARAAGRRPRPGCMPPPPPQFRGFSFLLRNSASRDTPDTFTTLNRTPGISPTAWPRRPKPAMRTSSCAAGRGRAGSAERQHGAKEACYGEPCQSSRLPVVHRTRPAVCRSCHMLPAPPLPVRWLHRRAPSTAGAHADAACPNRSRFTRPCPASGCHAASPVRRIQQRASVLG